ncbi:polyprenyl synthetase family protein [Zavarzinia sp. CC-PAN008]|uniref:polyprenyl synthetase family protein n=1 Tax=Zavarzinia sp. CC-PAN008 TaxID=3243332 RepID=UPI003F74772D
MDLVSDAALRPALVLDTSDWTSIRRAVNERLAALLPHRSRQPLLDAAVRAALLSGGKRVRPTMAVLACAHHDGLGARAVDFGCAVEMVHTASLVLDDLPCMDDAHQRRGAPALHRVHGEDVAILAAVTLLNQAHVALAQGGDQAPGVQLRLIGELGAAIGFSGLAAGQVQDLRAPERARTEQGLADLNHLKTGALFVAALRGGAMVAGADQGGLDAMERFGRAVGFAFQLQDDLFDAVGDSAAMGKSVGQDAGQLTFVDLWGVERVEREIALTLDQAAAALEPQGHDSPLMRYVRFLFARAGAAG